MLLPGETFPYVPLSFGQKQAVLNNCGGAPIEDPVRLKAFLGISGFTPIGNLRSYFFGNLANKSIRALDVDPTREAVRSFNRGALFYAGVINVATGTESLPLNSEVLKIVEDADGKNFALESYQALQLEVPSFCELAETVRPAMETTDDRLHQLALVGAGAVHLMVVRSVDKIMDASAEALDAAHPELAGLEGF